MDDKMDNESPVIFTSFCFWSSIGIPSTKQIKVTCDAEPSINNLNEEVDIAAWSSSWMYVSTPCSTRVSFSFHLRFTLGNEGSVEQLNMSSSPIWICSGPTIFRVVGLSKNQFLFYLLWSLYLHSIVTLVDASFNLDVWLKHLMFKDLYIFKA